MNGLARYCSYCNSDQTTEKFETEDMYRDTYKILFCNQCKAYFLYPFPGEVNLSRAYDVSYYGNHQIKFKQGMVVRAVDWYSRRRAHKVASLLPHGGSALDIGCGNGSFLYQLSKKGNFRLFGVERDMESASRIIGKEHIRLFIGQQWPDEIKNYRFDVVSLFHVFEHLADTSSIMDLLQEIVSERGYVFISMPYIESWQARFFKGKWFHLDPPRHLVFFSHQQLKQHFLKRGFYLVRRSFVSPEQNPYGAIQSILNQWFTKRDVLYERLKGNKEYANDYSPLLIFAQKFFFMTAFPFFVITDLIAATFRKSASFTMVFRKGEV